MKPFAKDFYKSKAWKDTREAYAKSQGYICETCAKKGLYSYGEIVHHIQELTPENINDPRVSLSWDNLRLVCRKCHAEEHTRSRRYTFGLNGEVIIK